MLWVVFVFSNRVHENNTYGISLDFMLRFPLGGGGVASEGRNSVWGPGVTCCLWGLVTSPRASHPFRASQTTHSLSAFWPDLCRGWENSQQQKVLDMECHQHNCWVMGETWRRRRDISDGVIASSTNQTYVQTTSFLNFNIHRLCTVVLNTWRPPHHLKENHALQTHSQTKF